MWYSSCKHPDEIEFVAVERIGVKLIAKLLYDVWTQIREKQRRSPSFTVDVSEVSVRAIQDNSTPARDHQGSPSLPLQQSVTSKKGEAWNNCPRLAWRPHWPTSRRSPSLGLVPRQHRGGTWSFVSMDTRSGRFMNLTVRSGEDGWSVGGGGGGEEGGRGTDLSISAILSPFCAILLALLHVDNNGADMYMCAP